MELDSVVPAIANHNISTLTPPQAVTSPGAVLIFTIPRLSQGNKALGELLRREIDNTVKRVMQDERRAGGILGPGGGYT